MNIKPLLAAILSASLLPSALMAADAKQSADQKFVMKAAQGGMVEVKLGELAGQKGKRDDVKQFGAKMVADHTKANEELKTVAQQKGITLSDDLDAMHKATYDKMAKMEGDEFDKAYIADMVKDHKKDISEFEEESKNGKDADVKAFATKTLPTLKEHMEHINKLAANKGGK